MSNNYAPCFSTIEFLVIPPYKERPCSVLLYLHKNFDKLVKSVVPV